MHNKKYDNFTSYVWSIKQILIKALQQTVKLNITKQ